MNRRSFFKSLVFAPLLALLPEKAQKKSGIKYVGAGRLTSNWTITTKTEGMTDIEDKTYYFDGENLVEWKG